MPKGVLMTAQTLWPIDWNVFAAYLLFFGFGWFLYPGRDSLPTMIRGHRTNLAAGSAMVFTAIPWLKSGAAIPVALLMGVATWLLIFGFFGLFLRQFERPSPAMRYLSDASYWLYLAHIPVVVFGVDVLIPLAWPAAAKFSVVVLLSTPLLLTTYHLFVRNTWIGVLLNGKRADRGPRAVVPGAAEAAAGH
jgi:peptidoglycan/LPS O-acetylase OafA/YrhL